MSQMDSRIILGAQQPNLVNAFAQGQALRAQSDQLASQNALRNLYQTQGANIFAGDQNALNSLAQIDPAQALAIRGQHQVQGQRDQAMQMRIAEYAKTISKEQAAAEAAKLEQGIVSAIGMYQAGDLDGLNALLEKAGIPPIPELEAFVPLAAQAGDALDILKSVTEFSAGPKPADEYGRYVAEETEAGRTPLSRIEYKRAGQKTQQLSVDKDGNVSLVEGFGDQKTAKTTEGEKSSAGYLSRMRAAEGILDQLSVDEPAVRSLTSLLVGGSNFEGLVLNDRQEKILQAQRDWVRAKLRKESGAVIGPEEMAEEIRTYFPLPGEGEGVVEQKRQARKEAERQFEIMSGAAGPQAERTTEADDSGSGGFQFQNDQQRQLFEKYRVPSAE